jgi:membrane protein YqaA with SNARE-associated domain
MRRLGGPGLVLWGLADNSFFPTPGAMDIFVILLSGYEKDWWWYYALMATIGSILGGWVTFRLSRKGGEKALEQKFPKEKLERVYRLYHRNAFLAIAIPALLPPPIPFSPFLATAGALNCPVPKFFAAVTAGRTLRYFAVAYFGRFYGRSIMGFLGRYYQPILWTFLALVVVGLLVFFLYYKKRRREGKPVVPDAAEDRAA